MQPSPSQSGQGALSQMSEKSGACFCLPSHYLQTTKPSLHFSHRRTFS